MDFDHEDLLEGTVRDEGGEPLPGVKVDDGSSKGTEADGTFVLRGLYQ